MLLYDAADQWIILQFVFIEFVILNMVDSIFKKDSALNVPMVSDPNNFKLDSILKLVPVIKNEI